jgi:hypothetical protein
MKPVEFPPARRRGVTLHSILLVILAAAMTAFVMLASAQPVGPLLALYIVLAALAFSPLPVLGYRLYALLRSNYSLDRDKLTLVWGLRSEQIPVSDIDWVRPLPALAVALPLPVLRLPGAVLGTRHHPDYGQVEFLASEVGSLLAVATARRVFVISPADATNFLENLQRTIEMGSLSPAVQQSVYPYFIVSMAWESVLVRYLWLAGLFLNIGLLAWVSLMIPSLARISLVFLPTGQPGAPVPAAGLLLLPAVSLALFLLGWAVGLAFYRRLDQRPLAHILWTSGVISTLVFLLAVVFIVITPA